MDKKIKGIEKADVNGPDENGFFFPFLSQLDLPGVPLPERSCLRCGKAVPAPKRTGRPSMFCSEACRVAQAAAQRAAWWRSESPAEDRETGIACRACGQRFVADRVIAGRLPHYCGSDCRLMGRRGLAAGYRKRRRQVKAGGG
ncbi:MULTISPECIES: hypothetical protein [unclassified Mesorhizobium]|uniref:hypothetical protein n=1 Tax=unclassified Mesorhizobium TaxID=325217 RepID=UPI00095B582D|nr:MULTISPECIES: hypothetical protein [unclassified Mesorhizobium]MBN9255833.1 hypothetical protein [Mesorhizobium sp.]OJX71450.1 MAG: hypothetical protein BGO93_08505 [Mesorhizobium sp. 65-26]